ncbi:MAG: site-2 protease family protein [bacterium]
MAILHFILFIGVLVFVHELGHFLVAKYFDVKVIRFSIGFGPTVVAYQHGETEYCIKALPLGGYVEMFGGDLESMEGMPEEERKRGLMAKPIWQRSLVTVAGPAFNIIFPILIYFVFIMGVSKTPPSVIGEVFAGMPAAEAGLKAGDKIVGLDGEPIDYWYQVIDHIKARPGETVTVSRARWHAQDRFDGASNQDRHRPAGVEQRDLRLGRDSSWSPWELPSW